MSGPLHRWNTCIIHIREINWFPYPKWPSHSLPLHFSNCFLLFVFFLLGKNKSWIRNGKRRRTEEAQTKTGRLSIVVYLDLSSTEQCIIFFINGKNQNKHQQPHTFSIELNQYLCDTVWKEREFHKSFGKTARLYRITVKWNPCYLCYSTTLSKNQPHSVSLAHEYKGKKHTEIVGIQS